MGPKMIALHFSKRKPWQDLDTQGIQPLVMGSMAINRFLQSKYQVIIPFYTQIKPN
jgi:hypothetical protein